MRSLSLTHMRMHDTGGLIMSAFSAWLGCIAISVIADVIRLALGLDSVRMLMSDRTDAIFLVLAVMATAWLFLRGQHGSLGQPQLLGVGILWVSMSLMFAYLYGIYISGHYVARFLVQVLTGNDESPGGWVWRVFLAAELLSPLTVGSLQALLSREHA